MAWILVGSTDLGSAAKESHQGFFGETFSYAQVRGFRKTGREVEGDKR